MKIIDLTHIMKDEMPVFPGTEKPVFMKANTIERDGFAETKISMYSHTGTHIDAPCHMEKGVNCLDSLSVEHFIGNGCVIDCTSISSGEISLDYIKDHEKNLKNADFVLIKTGWSKYWGRDEYFNPFPYLSIEAAEYLIGFNLKGIGVDTISIDDFMTKDFPVHYKLFKHNMIIIENLTNLESIDEEIFTFSCLPLKYENADGSPVRAAAWKI